MNLTGFRSRDHSTRRGVPRHLAGALFLFVYRISFLGDHLKVTGLLRVQCHSRPLNMEDKSNSPRFVGGRVHGAIIDYHNVKENVFQALFGLIEGWP